MKKVLLLLLGFTFIPLFSFSGGIVTNQNQSAAYIRMFARDASTDIDAVFFNPAGLTKLSDGFYLSLNYQYISQNKFITNDYVHFGGTNEYHGEVNVPIFPGLYAAYKKGKVAVSIGINPVGGGGSAVFDEGLPSFEKSVSDLVPGLSGLSTLGTQAGVDLDVTGYNYDAYLDGSSAFWGFQAGASYEINDMFSVYLGGRFVYAKNTYEGYLKDIMIENEGTYMRADNFINQKAIPTIDGTVTNLNGIIAIPQNIQPIIDGGYGALTLAQAESMNIITTEQYNGIIAGLSALDVTDPSTYTFDQTSATVTGATPMLEANIAELQTNRAVLQATAAVIADQEGDIVQTGTGFAPIIGMHITPTDRLSIGLKYEFQTKLELENDVEDGKGFLVGFEDDGVTPRYLYNDGDKFRNDMPAMFSAGIDYKITDKLSVATGFHMYFDKNADYGRKLYDAQADESFPVDNDEVIDRNSTEFALGLEYQLNNKLLVSIGYLNTQTGVTEDYQTDLSYSQHSNTIGFGGAYAITSGINMNVGFGYTVYNDARKIYEVQDPLGEIHATTEEHDKDNLFVAFGLDFKFGKNSD